MTVIELLHERLATTVMLFFLFVGIWGLIEYARGESLGGNIAGALIIGQVLVVVQVGFGVAMLVMGRQPVDTTHYLYGASAIAVMPFMWTYTRDRHPRQGLMLYSLLALFIFGLAVRGITTGGG